MTVAQAKPAPEPALAPEAEAPQSPARPLARRAARGGAWTTAHYAISQALRVVSNVVLARLLAPDDFGLLALVSVFVQGLQMFTELGIGSSIIQHQRGEDRRFLDTAWTLQALRGLVVLAGCALLAWPVAQAYGEPAILGMLPAVGLASLIAGFNSTALYTLNRRLELGRIMALDLGYQATIFAVAALWALWRPSAWALIGGIIAASLVRLALSHALTPGRRDRFGWDRDAVRGMLSFGVWIFVGTVFAFLSGQADRLMLPRMHGMQELGLYGVACTIALAPVELVSRLAGSAVFPAIAEKGRQDADAMRQAASTARRILLAAGLAGTVCVVLVAPLFIRALYPARYADAGWIAQLVAAAMWISLLQASIDRTLLAAGSPRDLAWAACARLVVIVPACLLLDRWLGLPGFVLGVAVGALASHIVVSVALARHGIALAVQDVKYTVCCLAACALGLVPARLFGVHADGSLLLAVQAGSAFVVCAGVCLWAFHRVRKAWARSRTGARGEGRP